MRFLSRKCRPSGGGWRWNSLWCLGLALLLLGGSLGRADDENLSPIATTIDMGIPSVMTGTLYELGSNRQKILFKFRRSATRNGQNLQVEQLFTLPDGSVACRENIHYRNNMLVAYQMTDLRSRARGSILVVRDSKKNRRQRILMEHVQERPQGPKVENGNEVLQSNTLISDTIYPFILTHWDELGQGTTLKFHFISLDPPDTFNFRLVKDGDATWSGKPVVRIKMEPTNLIIQHMIKPIYFLIETAAPHRLFTYTGRTTPRQKVGDTWKFIDAETVFDWK